MTTDGVAYRTTLDFIGGDEGGRHLSREIGKSIDFQGIIRLFNILPTKV